MADQNEAKSHAFLAENRSKPDVVTLPSGSQYRVIEKGEGARPVTTSEVTVHYRASLYTGFQYYSTYALGRPETFKFEAMISGWKEILPLMSVGDQWQVFLPPARAYGRPGAGAVGPNEAVIFDIKLLDVN